MSDDEEESTFVSDEWVLWGSYPATAGHAKNPFTGQPEAIKSAYVGPAEWQRAHDFLRAAGAVAVGPNRKRIPLGETFVDVLAQGSFILEQRDSQLKPMVTSAPTKVRIGALFDRAVVVTSAAEMQQVYTDYATALCAKSAGKNPFAAN